MARPHDYTFHAILRCVSHHNRLLRKQKQAQSNNKSEKVYWCTHIFQIGPMLCAILHVLIADTNPLL
jgi:hypothetical protein